MYTETLHYKNDRKERESFLMNIVGLDEVIFEKVEPTRIAGKPDTIARISNTDVLTIYDKDTNQIITRKLCRPNQLRKLMGAENVPPQLLQLAIQYKRLGWNEI